MDKVNYFLKALVLVIMLRCTMIITPSPDTITFEIFRWACFWCFNFVFLINWTYWNFLRSIHKINRSFMLILKLLRILSIDINKAIE